MDVCNNCIRFIFEISLAQPKICKTHIHMTQTLHLLQSSTSPQQMLVRLGEITLDLILTTRFPHADGHCSNMKVLKLTLLCLTIISKVEEALLEKVN